VSGGDQRVDAEYVLPLRCCHGEDLADLDAYLTSISPWIDVTVVDGSPQTLFQRNHERWSTFLRHIPPEPWPGRNGKVAGVVAGVRHARHEAVILADDDVRWDRAAARRALTLLDDADLVRPQNYFAPLPWHARWDTARSLLNRAFGTDYPGTYVLRRGAFLRMGGYDGDVLFENLELSRTIRAAGGVEVRARSVFVARRPPSTGHFFGQRVRQAYDDFAQPGRLALECSLLPALVVLLGRRPRNLRACLTGITALAIGLAEVGRRREGGRTVFPAPAALWAPCWLLERAVCAWLAVGYRLTGGVPYGGQRLRVAAHSVRELRERVSSGLADSPAPPVPAPLAASAR